MQITISRCRTRDTIKLVALEGTKFSSIARALYHLLKGDKIILFDLTMSAKKSKIITKLIETNKITWVLFIPYDFEVNMAFNISEKYNIYYPDELKSTNKIVSNGELVLKRYLVEKYSGYYFVKNYLVKHFPDRETIWYQEKKYNLEINQKMPLNMSTRFIGGVDFFLKKFLLITALRFVLGAFVASIALSSLFLKKQKVKEIKYGILLNFAALLNNKGSFSYDFLLNDKRVQSDDVLFILSEIVSENWLHNSHLKNENLTSIKKFFQFKTICSHSLRFENLIKKFKILIVDLFWFQGDPDFKVELVKITGFKLIWENFYNKFKIQNFIYSNNDGISQIVHNEICRLNGGVSWNYAMFIGGGYLYSKNKEDFERTLHPLWAYQNMDYYLAGGRDVCDYYKLHKQETKYLEVGNIFSSLTCLTVAGVDKCQVFQSYFKSSLLSEYKIISFFDTTFIDTEDCLTNYDDAINFYTDIEKLVLGNLNYFVIVKPAKPDSYYTTGFFKSELKAKKLINIWKSLREHPRVCWAGHSADKVEILQVSDVVVTHALSSPTAEAIGAGKKAFWYESNSKHKETFYANINGMVISGYLNLEVRIDELIYKVSKDEYDLYLERNLIPGLVTSNNNIMLQHFVDYLLESGCIK